MKKPVGDPYEEEHRLRKLLRSGKLRPTRSGAISIGRLPMGLYVRTQCEGHVFLVGKPKKNTHWQSGYCQGATCLVCDDEIVPIDSVWWLDLATPKHVRLAMMLAKEESLRLREVYQLLKGLIDGDKVRGNSRPSVARRHPPRNAGRRRTKGR